MKVNLFKKIFEFIVDWQWVIIWVVIVMFILLSLLFLFSYVYDIVVYHPEKIAEGMSDWINQFKLGLKK